MIKTGIYIVLNYTVATVWLINGLYCKVLNFVPRHQEIVARILGDEYSYPITVVIGVLEILMSIWIISMYKKKINALSQIVIIVVMNIIEFFKAPDLLLWGKWNSFFALLLCLVIFYNGFYLSKAQPLQQVN